jgi:hypothetical protein
MELIEGNEAPHMGATTTHGNAGYLTFYRNHASSQFAAPASSVHNGHSAAAAVISAPLLHTFRSDAAAAKC